MDQRQTINKALLLLDKGRDKEAITLLKELNRQATGDHGSALSAAAILGDYYYQASAWDEALHWLNEVNRIAALDPNLADIAGYEIDRSRQLLSALSSKQNRS